MARLSRKPKNGMAISEDLAMLTINGKRFVSGLHWKSLSNRQYMKEARSIGKKQGWDVVAIRKAGRVQAGFVTKGGRALKGTYSLASALAGVLGSSWIGVFRTSEEDPASGRYVLVAVREGAIMPGYDIVCDKDTALSRLKEAYNYFNSEAPVYAPADFGFGGIEKSLAELLPAKAIRRDYQLRELGFPWGTAAIFMLVMVSAVIGASEYQRYLEDMDLAEAEQAAAQRSAELRRLNAATKAEQAESALAHPWAKSPAPADFIDACLKELHVLPVTIGGWVVESAVCGQDRITTRFRRDGGAPLLGFKSVQQEMMKGWNLVVLEKGERAELSKPLTMMLAGDQALIDAEDIHDAVISRAQLLGLQLELNEANDFIPPAPGEVSPQQPTPVPWRHTTFKLRGGVDPSRALAEIQPRIGMRLREIALQVNTGGSLEWSMSGDIYAKR